MRNQKGFALEATIFLMTLMVVLGPKIENVVIGIGLVSWTSVAS